MSRETRGHITEAKHPSFQKRSCPESHEVRVKHVISPEIPDSSFAKVKWPSSTSFRNDIIKTIIFLLFLHFLPFSAYADFGVPCAPAPKADSTGYLTSNTAFGYLLSNIDMKTNIPDGCTQGDDTLRFCLKTTSGTPVCTPIQMNAGDSKTLGDISTDPSLGGDPMLADLPLSVNIIGNTLCLQMLTSRGKFPIVCRGYGSSSNVTGTEAAVCQNLGASCYNGRANSQSLLSFSGITVNCVRETLDKVFYTGNQCPQDTEDIEFSYLSPFPAFQASLQLSVMAALILYVMFYGFKLVLSSEYAELNKVAIFILKFIFVLYFSVGIPTYDQDGHVTSSGNGMTNTALPILLQLTSDFTEIVFLSGGSQGLCVFDPSKYQSGYEFYRVWDAVDCRIGYYFGMQLLYNIGNLLDLQESGTSDTSGGGSSAANFGNSGGGISTLHKVGVFTFFTVMFGFLMAGNIIIVLSGMLFAIMFISVIFYFLSVYLVSMVTLYVMMYISPIFVPMLLFERTKGYFDAWVKIVVSCALQPAVVGGFIALLLTMYDSVFYGNCEYLRHDYEVSGFNFSTFEIRLPDSEPQKCIDSPGYKLIQFYLGQGWETKIIILFEIVKINDFLNLGLSMVYLLIFIFIFYYALKTINEFVSDLTGGPSMGTVTVSPTAAMDQVMKGANKLANMAASGATKGATGDAKGAGEKAGESGDKVSTGEGGDSKGGDSKEGGGDSVDKVTSGGDKPTGSSGGGA